MRSRKLLTLSLCFSISAMSATLRLRAENKIPDEYKTGGFFIGCQAYTFKDFTVFEAIEKTALAGGRVIEFSNIQKLSKDEPNLAFDHNTTTKTLHTEQDNLTQTKG